MKFVLLIREIYRIIVSLNQTRWRGMKKKTWLKLSFETSTFKNMIVLLILKKSRLKFKMRKLSHFYQLRKSLN